MEYSNNNLSYDMSQNMSEDLPDGYSYHEEDTKDQHVLEQYADEINLVPLLKEKEQNENRQILSEIAIRVISGVDEDRQSQTKWMQDTDYALKLCRLTKEPKNTPWEGASNIKSSVMTQAALQFAARTYPEIIQDGKIVKTEIAGETNPVVDLIAEGISIHMSHQLLGVDSTWEEGVDRLLNSWPIIGCIAKKTYYDVSKKKICSDPCYYKDIIFRNDPAILSESDLRRITHVLHIHPNDLVEGARYGIYDKDTVKEILEIYPRALVNPECDLYEQHCFYDLDDDGYEEPYIVTVHKETNKVLRIVARYKKEDIDFDDKNQVQCINPIKYFTIFNFIPDPGGCFMGLGFGSLMLHSTETINTIKNQLIDAGSLANLQTGVMDSRLKIDGGELRVEPGTWTRVKGVFGEPLEKGFMPINYKEPSSVLFQLLGLLIQSEKDLTSSTDAMQGLQNATNVPATSMLAMIEQGMKLFSAIQRRLYRSLKEEFLKIYRLNSIYLDEEDYMEVLGPKYAQMPNIYKTKAVKVIPIADPNLASDAQRLAQAQVIMGVAQQPGSLINQYQAQKRMLQAAKVNNIDELIDPNAAKAPKQPDPKMIEIQSRHQAKMAEVQIKDRHQSLKEKEFVAKLPKMDADITHVQSSALKNVAEAQAIGHEVKSDDFNNKLQVIKTHLEALSTAHQQLIDAHHGTASLNLEKQGLDQEHQRELRAQDLEHQRAGVQLDQNQQEIDNSNEPNQNDGAPMATESGNT